MNAYVCIRIWEIFNSLFSYALFSLSLCYSTTTITMNQKKKKKLTSISSMDSSSLAIIVHNIARKNNTTHTQNKNKPTKTAY